MLNLKQLQLNNCQLNNYRDMKFLNLENFQIFNNFLSNNISIDFNYCLNQFVSLKRLHIESVYIEFDYFLDVNRLSSLINLEILEIKWLKVELKNDVFSRFKNLKQLFLIKNDI